MGKAKNLRDRVSSYFLGKNLLPKTAQLVSEISGLEYILTESEIDALLLEANLVRRFQPHFNIALKDGKNYPFIEITIKDKLPLVRITRQEVDPNAIYFGPYPTGSDAVGLLRFLRKIFPYASARHADNKPCFRSHIGLCPCREDIKVYRKTLKNLIKFLQGKRKSVEKDLKKEMELAAKNLEFEKANQIKRKLLNIGLVTAPRIRAWEYETNPNLVDDLRRNEVKELERILGIKNIKKIEAYDIANLSGKSATGSQVVFVDGVPEKKFYRRYKIKLNDGPNDVAMMKEMLSRRLKSDVPLPELIVIDGGKEHLISMPVKTIGLAKRLETIFTDDGRQINLPESSPALHLLQKMRDEAHRFSRKYHFYLRSKKMLE